MVECECILMKKLSQIMICFNRYMVECEFRICFMGRLAQEGFNRYMVECEFNNSIAFTQPLPVLIDTWWNVNDVAKNVILISFQVLIDTWWNVNNNTDEQTVRVGKRFNRYMVECEFK